MSRDALIKLLARHYPIDLSDLVCGVAIGCMCDEDFTNIIDWARHVASAIYPE